LHTFPLRFVGLSRSDQLLPSTTTIPSRPPSPRPMTTSLSRIASPFSSCSTKWCRRALTTSAYAETSSASPIPPKLDEKNHTRSGKTGTQNRPPRIFVRPWDGVPSMLDGFAMLRGIENKYGKIKAFNFIRVSFASGRSHFARMDSTVTPVSFLSFRTKRYPLRTFHTSGWSWKIHPDTRTRLRPSFKYPSQKWSGKGQVESASLTSSHSSDLFQKRKREHRNGWA